MKLNRLSLSIVTSLLVAAPLAQAQTIVAKQLAGSPSEFAAMAPVNPADAAIHSKSALLPVVMTADKSGRYSADVALPVESDKMRFLVFSGGALDWNVGMRAPGDQSVKAATSLVSEYRQAEFGVENASYAADYYAFDNIQSGDWSLKLSAGSAAATRGYVLLEGQSDTQLVSYATTTKQLVGERIGFVASLYGETADGEVLYGKSAGRVGSASLRVTAPDGVEQTYAMYDDGLHADGRAGDGIYGGDFLADKAGQYQAQVTVRGSNRDGRPVVRTAEHPLPILERSLTLSGTKAAASTSDGQRLSLSVPVAGEKAGRHYRGYAEVWGTDAEGQSVPVAWVSGMVTPDKGAVSLASTPVGLSSPAPRRRSKCAICAWKIRILS